jgi:hypothetical protein
MKIRKAIFRLMAGALILSLLNVGALAANPICTGDCACIKESGGQFQGNPIIFTTPHPAPRLRNIPEVSHPGHGYVAQAHRLNPDCCEGIVSTGCRAEPPSAILALQRSASSVLRSERSLPPATDLVSAEIVVSDHLSLLI